MPDIRQEHAIETYKSLIHISLEGFRLLALLNGGAAVALLAYLGNIATKVTPIPDMRFPMGCYLAGLVLCGLSFFGGYHTQLYLYGETLSMQPHNTHVPWLRLTTVLAALSLACFALGSWLAVSTLAVGRF